MRTQEGEDGDKVVRSTDCRSQWSGKKPVLQMACVTFTLISLSNS